ncbi:hypothetical protein [Sphingomonas sp. IW22]|uniref:hypothetical protein n=1 Tax=Sphingomonas sp. IW22 TaxID=3242489 RepID=UPI00352266D6
MSEINDNGEEYIDYPITRREAREFLFLIQEVVACQINLRATLIGGDPNSPFLMSAESAINISKKLQDIVDKMIKP